MHLNHLARALFVLVCFAPLAYGSEPQLSRSSTGLLRQFCLDCHSGGEANADLHLDRLIDGNTFETNFRDWQKMVHKVRQGEMPPHDADQPTDRERSQLIASLQNVLLEVAQANADDPGRVVLRRLTSAELNYTLQDLTELPLDLVGTDVADAVGGEGFTNVGFVQFFQSSTLEQYLSIAKRVADHAVIGADRLDFYEDPGRTGFELSAINRIRRIYREHGFRTSAGEGGEPFGLDMYPRAFFVAWQYRHRETLGLSAESLAQLAAREGLSPRFAKHIWKVVSQETPSFPTSKIADKWRDLPVPERVDADLQQQVRAACDSLYQYLTIWHDRFATADDDEAAPVLVEQSAHGSPMRTLKIRLLWPEGSNLATVNLRVDSADGRPIQNASVIWGDARIRFLALDRRWGEFRPFREVLSAATVEQLSFGRHPSGHTIGPNDFVTLGSRPQSFEMSLPAGEWTAELLLDAQLDRETSADRVVRCAISAGRLGAKGKVISALIADPAGAKYSKWRSGVAAFAGHLPQISHREPAPSDRDPIPAPFDNTYNMPERNFFHTKVKYSRDDRFLAETMLDEGTRARLDAAWADLLTSFEYHDICLQFVCDKFGIGLDRVMEEGQDADITKLDLASLPQLPKEAAEHLRRLHDTYHAARKLAEQAEQQHVADAIQFACRAWRRPLTENEQQQLHSWYWSTRRVTDQRPHETAIRAMLIRTMVAPEFLFRLERPSDSQQSTPLSDWELASRLSYFLWSSMPDGELRRAAAAGELRAPHQLARQARRMLRDEKARRFASEFFGQWFGFYRFDDYRGVDSQRFPEFSEKLKSALHNEAVTFFEHLIREDRPVREILFADYAFLNRELCDHYGIAADVGSDSGLSRVDGVLTEHRGGLFGLGAILTATSAPLRTSPVKRGDWILRRVLGTPVPPPPPDAGSIPADDAFSDGLTVRDRLEAHRQDPSCMTCHVRIDPLGFALEQYDAIGRWRQNYLNGEPIDASGQLASGETIAGLRGLRQFLQANEHQFRRTLCVKLVGYAMGRGASLSDAYLVEEMTGRLGQDGLLSSLVEEIVTSRQFRYHRGLEQ